MSAWRLGLLALLTAAAGCTVLAGLDGDYQVGQTGQGGTGNSNTTAGNGPGGGPGGGGNSTTGGAGMGGQPGGGGAGGAPGGMGGIGGAPGGMGGDGGSGGIAPTFQVACPGFTCNAGEVCCIEDAVGNAVQGCAAPGACPNNHFESSCDGPEDCDAGEVCCGTRANNHYTSIECDANCNNIIMCGGDNPGTQHCSGNDNCMMSMSIQGYWFCL